MNFSSSFPNREGVDTSSSGVRRLFIEAALRSIHSFEREGEFSGGTGEAQFASFLVEAYARSMEEKLPLFLGPRT